MCLNGNAELDWSPSHLAFLEFGKGTGLEPPGAYAMKSIYTIKESVGGKEDFLMNKHSSSGHWSV